MSKQTTNQTTNLPTTNQSTKQLTNQPTKQTSKEVNKPASKIANSAFTGDYDSIRMLVARKQGREGGRTIQKCASKSLRIWYVLAKHLNFEKFSLYLWCHNFRSVTTLVKSGTCHTKLKIRKVRNTFTKSYSTSRFWGGGCLFFSKNLAQKTTNKK